MYAYPPYDPQEVPHWFLRCTHAVIFSLRTENAHRHRLGLPVVGIQATRANSSSQAGNPNGPVGSKQPALDDIDRGLIAVGISDRRATHCLDLMVQLQAASASQCQISALCFWRTQGIICEDHASSKKISASARGVRRVWEY